MDFNLDPYGANSTSMFSTYESAFDSSPAQQLAPAPVPETPGFLEAPPNAIQPQEENPAMKRMLRELREQLEKLREKRVDMNHNKIPNIISALRNVFQEETLESMRERQETCIDMIKQLGD